MKTITIALFAFTALSAVAFLAGLPALAAGFVSLGILTLSAGEYAS